MTFFAPSLKRFETSEFTQGCDCAFIPVSITGSDCQLMCEHCGADILRWMHPATTPEALLSIAEEFSERGARGLLISGGSDAYGEVPLLGFVDTMRRIRNRLGLRIVVHTGLTSSLLAARLADAGVENALIDIVGSRNAIHDVCHLKYASPADYETSLANLIEAGVPASPHVVIGLERGVINGELSALKLISRYPVTSLVLVGLLPLRGTLMASATPPSPEAMGEIFLAARELMPTVPIMLGCERPPGEHKLLTDRLALKAGLNGIAYPAEGIITLARRMGLTPQLSELCCAMSMSGNTTPIAPVKPVAGGSA
ncbi:MAG: radical SAM protein [Thermoleophilia bacterium]